MIRVNLVRGSFYAYSGRCYHVPPESTGKKQAVPWLTCLDLSLCNWGPQEQKVTFGIASFHCSLSSVEILLITIGCAVGFDL